MVLPPGPARSGLAGFLTQELGGMGSLHVLAIEASVTLVQTCMQQGTCVLALEASPRPCTCRPGGVSRLLSLLHAVSKALLGSPTGQCLGCWSWIPDARIREGHCWHQATGHVARRPDSSA